MESDPLGRCTEDSGETRTLETRQTGGIGEGRGEGQSSTMFTVVCIKLLLTYMPIIVCFLATNVWLAVLPMCR